MEEAYEREMRAMGESQGRGMRNRGVGISEGNMNTGVKEGYQSGMSVQGRRCITGK
jgi:hypothetical protein